MKIIQHMLYWAKIILPVCCFTACNYLDGLILMIRCVIKMMLSAFFIHAIQVQIIVHPVIIWAHWRVLQMNL